MSGPISPSVRAHIYEHARPHGGRAAWVIAQTALGQAAALYLFHLDWVVAALLLDAAVNLRAFMIFHDACHGSFLAGRKANDLLGRIMQIWSLTPYEYWRDNHLAHHGRFGDLDFDDPAETIMFTKREYEAMPRWKRIAVRLLRDPVVFFIGAPVALWWMLYPFRYGNVWVWLGHAIHVFIAWQLSWFHLLGVYLAAASGLALFHLQHAVNTSYRARKDEWVFADAALRGSTHLPIPRPLTWCTLGIEFHHVHHFNPRVPSYGLATCHHSAEAGSWDEVNRVTFWKALRSLRNVMWDEERREHVPF